MKSRSLLIGTWAMLAAVQAVFAQAHPARPLEVPDDPPILRPHHQGPRRQAQGNALVQLGPWISYQVNVDSNGFNIPGDAGNEPSIAIDPTNPDIVVIGWRQFDDVGSNFRQAGNAYSHNGGSMWTNQEVLEPGVFRSDPVLDSDVDGNIYYYSLTGDFECWMFISADGGVTWTDPIESLGGDKAWFIVDKSDSAGQGHIYSAWSTAGNNYFPNQFTRSVDGGFNYEGPLELVQDPPRPVWGTLTTDSSGILYISGQESGDIYVIRSANARLAGFVPTFEDPVLVDMGGSFSSGQDPDNPNPGGLLGQVWIAADTSGGPTDGNLYMLAPINPPGSDPMDAMFVRSEDGGATWSSPIRVNNDAEAADHWQWFGTLSVAPNGRIDVIFNDTRNSEDPQLSELFYAYSLDAGATWLFNQPVGPAYDSHLGWPDQNKIGDYYDMISSNAEARIAYAATYHGEQDVYYLAVGDCNDNDIHDSTDISSGTSTDYNEDLIPDDCQCLADINASGDVDIIDLLELLSDWGPCPDCPADIDRDGEVSVLDLLILLAAWGPCP